MLYGNVSNSRDVKPKIVLNYIPESKKLKLQEQNKICYDNVIKVRNDSYYYNG